MEGDGRLAATVSARLSAAEGRKFGLTVGSAFLVFAGIALWREHSRVSTTLAVLGGLFAFGGLIVPTQMGPVMGAWMRLALAISKVTTPIIMSLVYFLVITPIGVVMRLVGHRPLAEAAQDGSHWKAKPPLERRSDLRRQF